MLLCNGIELKGSNISIFGLNNVIKMMIKLKIKFYLNRDRSQK